MPSESHEPFSGSEQEWYRFEQPASADSALTARQGHIDPMGVMGKIFASVGAVLVVIGVLLAVLIAALSGGSFVSIFLTLAGAWATGLVFLLLRLIFLLFFRNVASAQVVDRYFKALANQDYTTAFLCLNPGIRMPQDELDAQTWFARRAQAYDEQGPITAYSLRSFQLNPGNAMYAVRVTRSGRSYTVHLSLAKRGDAWKIIGFDLF